MDFELTEDLKMIRDMARDFAEKELLPRATKHDRQGSIDPEVFTMLGELGLWGLTVPEQYGGAGMGNVALSLVLEELNRACASTGVTVSVHNRGAVGLRSGVGARCKHGCPDFRFPMSLIRGPCLAMSSS